MQVFMLRKIALLSLISCSLSQVALAKPLLVKNPQKFTDEELILIKRAQIQFKKAKKSIQRDAHVDRFSCTFKLDPQMQQRPLETISKVYFAEYHMEPTCNIQRSIAGEIRPEEVVEVVYQNHKKHQVTLVCKDKHNHRRSIKNVELASSFDAA